MTGVTLLIAFACTCPCVTRGEAADRADAFEAAAWVVDVRVAAATVTQWTAQGLEPSRMTLVPETIEYQLLVQRRWKGSTVDTLRVVATRQPTTCGRELLVGEYYIIYLNQYRDGLTIDTCTRAFPGGYRYLERNWLNSSAPSREAGQ